MSTTVAYWAGHDGYVWHSKTQFRSPAFEGDVTYIDGEVVEKHRAVGVRGARWSQVQTVMTTQDGETYPQRQRGSPAALTGDARQIPRGRESR